MKLIDAQESFMVIKSKAYDEGISYKDYKKLKKLLNSLDGNLVATNKKWFKLYEEIDILLRKIFVSGMLNKYSEETCHYIERNAFLLPLVLANNTHDKIRMYGDNSYRFLCQFHDEVTPSMGVSDLRNVLFCFGCGFGANVVKYIQEYENLSFKDAIQLLAQIYLIDIKHHDEKLDKIVKKYQSSITSDQYRELLEMGFNRLKDREIYTYSGKQLGDAYKKRLDTIERIKNQEYDSEFTFVGTPKSLQLKS